MFHPTGTSHKPHHSVIVFDKEIAINSKRCLVMRLVTSSHNDYMFNTLHLIIGPHQAHVTRTKHSQESRTESR